jgi:hypothetical protein
LPASRLTQDFETKKLSMKYTTYRDSHHGFKNWFENIIIKPDGI